MEGEIREYNGEKLSSISAFRENSISGAPDVDLDSYRLEVVNSVGSSKSYRYEEVLEKFTSMKKVVSLYCVEGWSVRVLYEGVLMREILEDVGITENDKVVILYSIDGYTTSLLVAEGKWGYKWARWINKIELSSDINFRGFWESRGYSNEGDLDKSFLED
jgi:DMSO/TMAO reductase YedYZ molybdopterin-dependent catalytic subunit